MRARILVAVLLAVVFTLSMEPATAAESRDPELGIGAAVDGVSADESPAFDATSEAVSSTSGFESERALILQNTNALRAQNGLPPLRVSAVLHTIAQDWSARQASAGVMSHRPRFTSMYPSGWSSAAENVAAGYRPASVVDAWAGSPGHRANLLSSSTHIGIGVAMSAGGRLYYTQNFARFTSPVAELQLTPPDGYRFFDVPPGRAFAQEIEWLASTGITTGYPDSTFRPLETVNRDAMAAFLYRFAGEPDFSPPAVSPFTDVPTTRQFYKEITWMASTGVTTGYPDGTFRPLDPVAREAMAAFLYRFAGEPEFDVVSPVSFTDVTPSRPFSEEILWLASTGITTGHPDGSFRPQSLVNRDAMAAFLYRFHGLGLGLVE